MEAAAVISRVQRILVAALIIAIVVMATLLIRLRERAQDRLHMVQDSAPPAETAASAPQTVTLVIPNDLDGSLQNVQRSLSLPADDSGKARTLLEDLLETFREPHSTHPVSGPAFANGRGGGAGVENVFLMPVLHSTPSLSAASPPPQSNDSGTMAVVDFSAAFAASQPSGIEPETLTLLSIIGTLHANMPSITQVRFLVDGRPAPTLAGHADLTRTYLVTDTTTGPK
jgi:hypothetical protein